MDACTKDFRSLAAQAALVSDLAEAVISQLQQGVVRCRFRSVLVEESNLKEVDESRLE